MAQCSLSPCKDLSPSFGRSVLAAAASSHEMVLGACTAVPGAQGLLQAGPRLAPFSHSLSFEPTPTLQVHG